MKAVITGATGMIGSALAQRLAAAGHAVVPLRRPADWDPARGTIDPRVLEGADLVVHLAGESIFGRWTAEKKRRIRESRVEGTRLLADAIARLERRPAALLAASAVGYYGDRGDEALTEQSASGDDFLAEVAREWEAATGAASRAGVRVVNLRFGIVLSPAGGALGTMLPPFRLGVGGPIGSGTQYVSWIAIDDLLDAIVHLFATPDLSGPCNVTAPNPVTNREFAKSLGRVLRRPAVVPVPTLALRLAFGTEGAAMLRASQRVLPVRLQASGFQFRFPEIEAALRHVLD